MYKHVFVSAVLVCIAGSCFAQCFGGRCCNLNGYRWIRFSPVVTSAPEEVKFEEPEQTKLDSFAPDSIEEQELDCKECGKACSACRPVENQPTEQEAEQEAEVVPENTSLTKVESSLGEIPAFEDVVKHDAEQTSVVAVSPFCVRAIALVNQFRAARGLPELKLDESLCSNCESHSVYMARFGFQHAYGAGLECIASGVNTPESLVNMWMNSPAHAGILLSPGCRFIGIGSCSFFHTARVK